MTDRQRQLLREIADGKLAEAPGVGSGWRKRAWTSLAGKAAMLDDAGKPIAGVYCTGWIKRGPVGLIGHTKSDAMETIENLVADVETLSDPSEPKLESTTKSQ